MNEVSRWFQNESLKENATEFYHGPCSAHIVHKTGKLSLQVTCENGDIPQNISSNGGSGGVGGDFGKIVVIGLEQRPKICLLQKAGEHFKMFQIIDIIISKPVFVCHRKR